MRNRYIVAYDVSDGKRLRRVFKKMNGFGDALQYSVFACDLSSKERVLMEEALTEIINLKEDRVIIIDIGPVEGRGGGVMRTLGRQASPREREALVV
ncbi:MAG: CRISPR-associated endonuclease Cas2 [Caldilineaceae bacterium SB0665_bin_25]|nr:CRISPR-associated endonuclease Cas2 [Caldilineaceae bacterium]MXZ22117.1 CRISPR-associated endonuclease Cas2 [Caldilineaceae bacterium SB0665_bin_25]